MPELPNSDYARPHADGSHQTTQTSEPQAGAFTHADYSRLLADTIDQIVSLSKNKGGEYAGDVDRLANFRRNGVDLDLPMEVIWRVYCAKHWDAVGQYIRDLQSGKQRTRLEPISGRVDDMIVYLILFKAMLVERGELKLEALGPNPAPNPFVSLANSR
jgi:hypothetical protein